MTNDEIISEMQTRVVETLNAYEMPATVKILILENAILRYNIALQKQKNEEAATPSAQDGNFADADNAEKKDND